VIRGEIRGSKKIDSNTLPEALARLFSNKPSYDQFATSGWKEGTKPKDYSSLEAVHGNVHGFTGGSGQMGNSAVAAFDPIFWSVLTLGFKNNN
jgi:tyrosinase